MPPTDTHAPSAKENSEITPQQTHMFPLLKKTVR